MLYICASKETLKIFSVGLFLPLSQAAIQSLHQRHPTGWGTSLAGMGMLGTDTWIFFFSPHRFFIYLSLITD